jgi:dTDP-4-dehydrorhamnose reductase
MKVFVTGAGGQLGQSLQRLSKSFNLNIEFKGSSELDITNSEALTSYFDSHKPEVLINCAAYTAVDQAEKDQENAERLNSKAPETLATLCAENHCQFIHISTDYVFDGKNHRPYLETDPVMPTGVYGKTKMEGENKILKVLPQAIIIRTSWLYSEYRGNFMKTMLRLGKEKEKLNVIFDQVGTPTYAGDLAKAILTIIDKASHGNHFVPGIYHFSNEGVCSWYDFAWEIMNTAGFQCSIYPIETKDYPTLAQRPHYSVLNKEKIKSTFGIEIPNWKESLKTCYERIVSSSEKQK